MRAKIAIILHSTKLLGKKCNLGIIGHARRHDRDCPCFDVHKGEYAMNKDA